MVAGQFVPPIRRPMRDLAPCDGDGDGGLGGGKVGLLGRHQIMFLPRVIDSCKSEIASVMTKKSVALAIW